MYHVPGDFSPEKIWTLSILSVYFASFMSISYILGTSGIPYQKIKAAHALLFGIGIIFWNYLMVEPVSHVFSETSDFWKFVHLIVWIALTSVAIALGGISGMLPFRSRFGPAWDRVYTPAGDTYAMASFSFVGALHQFFWIYGNFSAFFTWIFFFVVTLVFTGVRYFTRPSTHHLAILPSRFTLATSGIVLVFTLVNTCVCYFFSLPPYFQWYHAIFLVATCFTVVDIGFKLKEKRN